MDAGGSPVTWDFLRDFKTGYKYKPELSRSAATINPYKHNDFKKYLRTE